MQDDDHGAVHLRREALTMGLYVSITLLAALTVTDSDHGSDLDVLAVVWGTTLGLAIAHWCAFGLAHRLVDPESTTGGISHQVAAQATAAFTVAAIATAAVVVFPDHLEQAAARFATAALIGVVAFGHARAFGASHARAVTIGAIVLGVALAVAGVKHTLGH